MPTIKLKLNTQSINQALKELKAYQKKVERAGEEIAKRLGEIGYSVAYSVMQGHVFSGETIESLTLEKKGEGRYVLYAESQAILFFEFGAGSRSGYGHPWAGELNMGPGTYPGAGHWDDPNGWWFPTDDPRLIIKRDDNGQGWGHSYGNQPHMPFYNADKAMRESLLTVAREVLKS